MKNTVTSKQAADAIEWALNVIGVRLQNLDKVELQSRNWADLQNVLHTHRDVFTVLLEEVTV